MRGRGEGLRPHGRCTAGILLGLLAWGGVQPREGAGQDADRTSALAGLVVEVGTRRPLSGVRLMLSPVRGTAGGIEIALTGGDGAFAFETVAPGLYQVSAVLIGYATIVDTLAVEPDARLEATVVLTAQPLEVDSMVVEVDRPGPLGDFDQRRRIWAGTFFTRENIEATGAVEFSDLMRTVPGVRVVPAGFGNRLMLRNCRPDLWLDGVHVGANVDVDSFLRPADLEAVEVYRGTVVPGEFGVTRCGAVVAWSRRGQAEPTGNSLKKQLFLAGSLIAAFVIIRH